MKAACQPSANSRQKKLRLTTFGQFVLVGDRKSVKPSAFESFIAEKQIPEPLWLNSAELREWVKRNADRRYIPEFLLAAFDVRVNDKFSFIHAEGIL